MRIALDATYSVDRQPSGIAVYSREILSGLAAGYPGDAFLHCYRPKQFKRANISAPNVRRRLLLPPVPTFRARIYHALNQRVDSRPAPVVITTFHDLFVLTGEYSSPEFRARFAEQARRAAAQSDWIISVSEFTAKQVSGLLGFDRRRIRVVPHGIHLPPSSKENARTKTVLFVGALQVRKNVARLIEAFEALPRDWKLVLAGAPSGYGAEPILQRIAESSARDRIVVAGYVSPEELQRLYGEAAIFAFPSLDEGFGIPVLEAMGHGIPVLTSNGSALAEVAGDAALMVDPERTEEIAEGLQRLAWDEDLREALSIKGRARAHEYPWKRSVRETYLVYREAGGCSMS